MAISKTVTASASFITFPPGIRATIASGITPAWALTPGGSTNRPQIEPDVYEGQLVPPNQMTNPGVFTAGTASEGTMTNPLNNSNA